jgi:hypothetical protein
VALLKAGEALAIFNRKRSERAGEACNCVFDVNQTLTFKAKRALARRARTTACAAAEVKSQLRQNPQAQQRFAAAAHSRHGWETHFDSNLN